MVTALQIILVLVLIALVGILLGYLFGKLSCKKDFNTKIIQKGTICEEEYNKNMLENNKEELDKIDDLTNNETDKLTTSQSLLSTKLEDSKKKEITNNDKSSSNSIETKEKLVNDSTKPANENQNIVSKEELKNSETKNKDKESNITQAKSSQEENKASLDNKEDKLQNIVSKEEPQNSSNEQVKEDNKTNEPNESSNENEKTKPQSLLSSPKDNNPDNLCKIKGIGKVIEEKLNNLGIYHFEQIASFTETEVAWVDEHLSFKGRILREDWIGQAKILAQGGETEFSKRVEKGEVESSKK
jgi:predicted flap endonuclease-1-like 5' DNA nuclease